METILRAGYDFWEMLRPNTNAVRQERYSNGARRTVHGRTMETPMEISIPVPGLGKNDLNVYLQDRVLTVTTQLDRASALVSNDRTQLRHSFVVPDDVDTDRIEAKCKNGLLTIKLKKTGSKRSVSIKVQGPEQGLEQQVFPFSWWKKIRAKAGIGGAVREANN